MYDLGNSSKNLLVSSKENNKYYDENIIIDINDKNNTHSIIAKYIKKNSIVLDVGCGAGYIGKLLKDKNCKIYGIDLDEEALKIANKIGYDFVYNFSIMDENNKDYKNFFNMPIKFDYIIFADVLEHIIDPGLIINNFSKKLNTNGEILTSIPNIAHFDIIKGLVNRKFNYNKIGLLDNTHLRFFTKSSFYEMIEGIKNVYNLNFSIKEIGKTISEPDYISNYEAIKEILNDDDEICTLQYVFALKKTNKITNYDLCNDKDYFLMLNNIIKNNELLEQKAKNYQIILQDILNSNSWKLTKPLRILRGKLKIKK